MDQARGSAAMGSLEPMPLVQSRSVSTLSGLRLDICRSIAPPSLFPMLVPREASVIQQHGGFTRLWISVSLPHLDIRSNLVFHASLSHKANESTQSKVIAESRGSTFYLIFPSKYY